MMGQLGVLVVCAATARAGANHAIPRVEVAPGVALPMVTLGGVVQAGYPDPSNYSLWLELGGRGFDSAWEYQTEKSIAAAIRASGLPRSEIFITSKIPGSLHGGCCGCPGAMPPGQWPPCLPGKNGQPACHGVCFPASGHYTPAQAKQYIAQDLEDLGPDIGYIDLLLLHQPCDYIAPYPYNASTETAAIYGAMEDAFLNEMKGKIRALGVSNFDANMLELLSQTSRIKPAVNQCRMTVGMFDSATAGYCKAHGITYQAYSTLHTYPPAPSIAGSTVIKTIAEAHGGVSNQQVAPGVTQKGIPLVTASNITAYDVEDIEIFKFNLTEAEMETLDHFELGVHTVDVCAGPKQDFGSMSFAGHEREYYVSAPPAGKAPRGLIIALTPADITGAMWFCRKELADVSTKTGALVVCPAARIYNNSGPGHPGGPNPCWLSFAHNGYCMGGQPESSEDVDFLAALILQLQKEHAIPPGRTIMSGISNGGSGAFRFNCEHAELIDGLVIGIQAWFDPYVGYFDYVHHKLPIGKPQCKPQKLVPLYSADGTKDWFYGQPPCFPGFESVANWQNYSTNVLGCKGAKTTTQNGPHNFPQGSSTTCYEYSSCPAIIGSGLNVMCEVEGMTHDGSALGILLPAAFADFFEKF